MREPLCIIGASGFVGGRALAHAAASGRALRVLAHRRPVAASPSLDVIEGDANDAATLKRLITPGSIVLNFAYGGDDGAERLARALAAACAARGAKRLLHASSCSVYGRTTGRVVDESTECRPVTAYEQAKYRAEQILEAGAEGTYELVILRPTAVFGAGGRNLETLARRVMADPWPKRYVRACAMGRRRMHAVDVERVAAAALFLATAPLEAPVERFIVSQDDEAANNYAAIEAFFVARFGAASYPIPPVTLPASALRVALRLAGRSNAEPELRYSAAKLTARGLPAARAFHAGLEEYAAWLAAAGR